MRHTNAKKSPPAAAAGVKREEQAAYRPSQQQPAALPQGVSGSGSGAAQAYHHASLNGQTPYPALAYGDQPQGAGAPYQPDAAMFYGSAATAAGVADSAAPNPLAAFASQAAQHVGPSAPADIMWQAGRGNTWHDWTAAIADSQERYSASALLTLGNPARASVPSSVLADGTVAPPPQQQPTAADMGMVAPGGQWPLIMFDHTQQQ